MKPLKTVFTTCFFSIVFCAPSHAFNGSSSNSEFLSSIPHAQLSEGVPARENPAYALKRTLRRSDGKLFGNWAVDLHTACISATRGKYILASEIKTVESIGKCGRRYEVIRIFR